MFGYYRKFIGNYATIDKPLTSLLKKDPYLWNKEAQSAFTSLKEALTNAPIFGIPDFSKTFIVEIDAFTHGIGAMLTQSRHPLAFISKTLGPKW